MTKLKDVISKSDIQFWFGIIAVVVTVMTKVNAVETRVELQQKDIVTIREDISEIKLSLRNTQADRLSALEDKNEVPTP